MTLDELNADGDYLIRHKAYTLTDAVLSGDEANFGSIEVEKWAELAVLSGDPLTTPVEELLNQQAAQTYVAGE